MRVALVVVDTVMIPPGLWCGASVKTSTTATLIWAISVKECIGGFTILNDCDIERM